jgi:transcriptional regulator with XRE-family HTH domain
MPNINTNSLALRRKRLGYDQKQIAVLLGHKTKHQLCRYETGQRTPGLKEAIKLSMLYGVPVRVLFDHYFLRCQKELKRTIKGSSTLTSKINLDNVRHPTGGGGYCSYLELLNSARLSQRATVKIRRHIKVLVEEKTKKLHGN